MQEPKRIASLVGPGVSELGYRVPDAVIGDGFTSEQVETRIPNLFINELDRTATDLAYAEAALRAQEEGFAAVVINSVGDFGLGAMRDALSIPAVGGGQAAMQLAAGFGERFGIVTVWPEATSAMFTRLLRDYGLSDRCVGVKYVTKNADLAEMDGENGVMARMRSGGAPGTEGAAIVTKVELASRVLVAEGADVIMLGCTCMTPIHPELSRRLEHPVIEPLSAAHKLAETLITLGLRQAPPISSPMTAATVRDFFDGSGPVDAAQLAEDGCGDVCAVIGADDRATAGSAA
jgi:allantoin racemase